MPEVQTYVLLEGLDVYEYMEVMLSWFYADGIWWFHNYYPDMLFTTVCNGPS